MLNSAQDVTCRYNYDPLDRIVGMLTGDARILRFYCKSRLTTEIQDAAQRSVFQYDDHLLAQKKQLGNLVEASLLATDQMRSVLQTVKSNRFSPFAYSPYGHHPAGAGLLSLLGFNGQRPELITGHYLLGHGYRAFNPVLMRFNSQDNLAPFGMGGLNPYSYCMGDPINRNDENGHVSLFRAFRSLFGKPKTFDILYQKKHADYLHDMFMKAAHLAPEPPIRHIRTVKDLDYLTPGDSAKFVFTKNKKLIIGKQWSWDYRVKNNAFQMQPVHHGSLTKNESSRKVISAGYMHIEADGSIKLDNHSGHYKPTFKSLHAVKRFMKKENIAKKIALIRHEN
jgi:RHS repeat-associated protein